MKRLAVFLLALFLSACGHTNPNEIAAISPGDLAVSDTRSVVVVGLALTNFRGGNVQGAWIEVDPKTGMRVDARFMTVFAACGVMTTPLKYLGSAVDACDGEAQYDAFELEPGTYALGWLQNAVHFYQLSNFANVKLSTVRSCGLMGCGPVMGTKVEASNQARIRADTPTFSVATNEVVYVGDIVADFAQQDAIHWTQRVREDRARAFLKSDLAKRMVVRPWHTVTGNVAGQAAGSLFPGYVDLK